MNLKAQQKFKYLKDPLDHLKLIPMSWLIK